MGRKAQPKLERSSRLARLRYKASLQQINYDNNRLDRNQVYRLSTCDFIKQKKNIIIVGSTGTVKSFLAHPALGYMSVRSASRTVSATCQTLRQYEAHKDRRHYLKELAKIEMHHLLLNDAFDLTPLDYRTVQN